MLIEIQHKIANEEIRPLMEGLIMLKHVSSQQTVILFLEDTINELHDILSQLKKEKKGN